LNPFKQSQLFIFKVILLAFSLIFESNNCYSQRTITDSSSHFIIDNIIIIGNKKTKEKIILRELNFKEGDSILASEVPDLITVNKSRIFNTILFLTVDIILIDKNFHHAEILIHVKERWFIYPIPIFEFADRNFNEWWQLRNRDPERINLGINYLQKNVRGRNETLRAKFQLGFTKKFELFYFIPYLNKKQTIGLNLDISYIINKQIPFKTTDHRLVYFDGREYIRNKFRTGILFSYRKKFYQTHVAGVSFNYNTIGDTIANLNPDYFLDARTTQQYFSIKYAFISDRRDVNIYPLKGRYLKVEAEKLGLGFTKDINQLNLQAELAYYTPLSKKLFLAAGLKQKVSFPKRQAYSNVRALGYDKDYVSGYELYVLDGQHFTLSKINLKYQIISTKKHVENLPSKEFKTIPFTIYFKLHTDAGYVTDNTFNPENKRLVNEFLIGGGAGLDLVSYYNIVLRLEYSINRLGNHGFFIHFSSAI
jgi:outer membrane protein assembly factor BamA